MRIKIIEKGFAGYTGKLGSIDFEDAISEPISLREANQLAAIMRIEVIEGDEMKLEQNARRANMDTPAPNVTSEKARPEDLPSAKKPEPKLLYTREQLEAIADDTGIKGLRQIADKHNISARAIPDLIDKLIQIKG